MAGNEAVAALSRQAEIKRDERAITVAQSCIRRGIRTKKALTETAYREAGIPRAKMEALLPRYAGTTPGIHFWNYTVQDRGAQVFELLAEPRGTGPGSQVPRVPAPPPAADPLQNLVYFDDEEIEEYEDVKF